MCIIAAAIIILFGVIATLMEKLALRQIKKASYRAMPSITTYRWLLVGALLHYLITLILWHDA